MSYCDKMWVLICRVQPSAPWEVMAFGVGDSSKSELETIKDARMRDEDDASTWDVVDSGELTEMRNHGGSW